MIKHFYYNKQLKSFIVGFANVFAGLQVQTGLDACGVAELMDVPIRYGSTDRVVAALGAANTQNKLYTLPLMSCYMTGLDPAPDRLHGVNQTDTRTYLEQGGVYPTDVKAIRRLMPIPYNMVMELSIHASNTDQLYQVLEQILVLFDYSLQLQFNDAAFDWTKLTTLTLVSVTNEENYPAGVDPRSIIWSLQFEMPIWLSPPADVRQEIIQTIQLRIGDVNNLTLDEIDAEGNLAPFTQPYSETTITSPVTVTSSQPPEPPTYAATHYDPGLDDCKC